MATKIPITSIHSLQMPLRQMLVISGMPIKQLSPILILLNIMNASLAVMSKKWRYRLPLTFFGLDDRYIENVYEQFFILKYHGGWSFIEAYNLPVGLRMWFVRRLEKQFEDEREAMEKKKKKSPGSR